jgi:hypothetical protein
MTMYAEETVEVGTLAPGDCFHMDGKKFQIRVNDGQRYLVVDEIGHTNTVHLDCEVLVWPDR